MPTITAISSSIMGQSLNLLDPATWVGGVVPGPGDTAVLPHTVCLSKYRNQGSTNTTSGYYIHPIVGPWSGSQITKGGVTKDVHIQVFNESDLDISTDPNNSGSIYARLYSAAVSNNSLVKIDYKHRGEGSTAYFYSCSIDQSFRPWSGSLWSASYVAGCQETSSEHTFPTFGRFYYNNSIF